MTKIKPQRTTGVSIPGVRLPRYRRVKKFVIFLVSLVSLTPLLCMTAFYYLLDQTALRTEIRYNVRQILSNTKRSLEFILEERQSAMTLLVQQESCASLSSDEGLAFAFRNLKNSFGGFVDLGVIDSKGNQNYYVGPYNLKGQNYADQEWFHEVNLRGIFISDVFMGFRNFPHFIIAVKNETPDGDYFVLRASIDLAMFDRQIHSTNYNRSYDTFLINQDAVLQTASETYGEHFQKYPMEIPPYDGGNEVIKELTGKGKFTVLGSSHIEQSPFILIVVHHHSNPIKNWLAVQTNLIWFLSVSCVLILIVTFLSANYMITRIKEADLQNVKAFHNIEYTNKMATIGRMAAGVAHEINNPLAIINEKAGLLQDLISFTEDFPQKEKTSQAVTSILNSVTRCSAVTHRLLGFGRRMERRQEVLDLEMVIKEVLGFINQEAGHRNVKITVKASESAKSIESDRGQLQQVFLNLINNALSAVDDGGSIEISIEPATNGKIAIAIRDNGAGISEENLDSIFEPFFSTKGEFGTGLGLSITYDIVDKLGGEIEVQSKFGEGTCFTVYFPRSST